MLEISCLSGPRRLCLPLPRPSAVAQPKRTAAHPNRSRCGPPRKEMVRHLRAPWRKVSRVRSKRIGESWRDALSLRRYPNAFRASDHSRMVRNPRRRRPTPFFATRSRGPNEAATNPITVIWNTTLSDPSRAAGISSRDKRSSIPAGSITMEHGRWRPAGMASIGLRIS